MDRYTGCPIVPHCMVEPGRSPQWPSYCGLPRQVFFGDRFSYYIEICMRTLSQEYVVFQDRWSLIAVVSQGRFHCR